MPKHDFKSHQRKNGSLRPNVSSAEIHLIDNRTAIIDGAKCVVEYTPCCVRLNLGKRFLCFAGEDMTIKTLCDDKIIVEGIIATVGFSS